MINFQEALEEIAEAIDGKTLDMIVLALEQVARLKAKIGEQDEIILAQKDRIINLKTEVEWLTKRNQYLAPLAAELADRVNHVCGDCVREG